MIPENSSDIIQSIEQLTPSAGQIDIVHFRDGKILAVSSDSLAFFKDRSSFNDPLGNGLLNNCDIPSDHALEDYKEGWIKEYRAGYIGLQDGKVLLITPIAVQLFQNKDDALRNNNQLASLDLPITH
ncbi:Uncharacterised protein [BD1-7 clade bacterium]|uniref:Uncharacterized protein n=1 Tax=BD1-7 clade bacterium TaxID=2029982 RepID=A0A5S9Q0E5_9GAMM|nr:Uncharacterised protein [BD1-7 clade bacterium]CAA0112390.1 Uncharacterised protein [BD1-7 clade bacterium]